MFTNRMKYRWLLVIVALLFAVASVGYRVSKGKQQEEKRYEALSKPLETKQDKVLSKEDINKLIASAENGSSEAQKELGNVYYDGKGTAINLQEAVHWWTKAADQKNAAAQYNLGAFYLEDGRHQDFDKALAWFNKSAKNGVKVPLELLRMAKEKKEAAEQRKAIDELTASAESGSPEAQKELGNVYYNGKGTVVNRKKAEYWWTKAADQKNAAAQYNLGILYLEDEDFDKAILWLNKASKNGDKDARGQLKIAKEKKKAEEQLRKADQEKLRKSALEEEQLQKIIKEQLQKSALEKEFQEQLRIRVKAQEMAEERRRSCVLRPNTFVFLNYDDIKNYVGAMARGEDQDFLFDKYKKANKIKPPSLTGREGTLSEVKVVKVSDGIAMIKDIFNLTFRTLE